MNLAQSSAQTALQALNTLYNSATLSLYQGTIPTSPEKAIGSQIELASFTFANPAFGTPAMADLQQTATAAFAATSLTPSAGGTACFARAVASTYGTVLADYTVGMTWAPSAAVMVGQYVVNNANTYVCTTAGTTAASGGPNGTGTNITDGTATWTWNNAGSPDIMITTTVFSTGVPVTMQSMTQSLPAV